jgi:hypothetical protein
MMDERRKSYIPIVPAKRPNKDETGRERDHGEPYTGTKAETPDTDKGEPTGPCADVASTAEDVEGRGVAKGNPAQQDEPRTQSRTSLHSALERIRGAARGYPSERLSVMTEGKNPVR